MSIWTEERSNRLTALHAEGHTYSEIADILGEGISRSAVSGRVHRMKLPARPTKARSPGKARSYPARRAARAPAYPVEAKRPQRPALTFTGTIPEPVSLNVTLMALADTMCKWPHGDPRDSGFHFCGHKQHPGSSYCEYHACMAYQPPRDRRRVAEAA